MKSTTLKINVVANFIGNCSGPALSFICVPFYLRYIGAEGYGLIGIFTSLQVILSFLDGGLSITLNRELAGMSAIAGSEKGMRNLVRTLGSIYWLVAILAGIIAISMSSFMAHHWVHPNELSRDLIQKAFMLMSISLVFQLPYGFYSGGLLGLQRHLLLNIFRVVFAILRSFGALAVLIFYEKSVTVFFGWILIINIIQAVVLRFSVWYALPKSGVSPTFDQQLLKKIGRFAGGITSITIISAFLSQIDKLILSQSFTLSEMGYYTLAQTIAGMLVVFIVPPFTQSLFPQFSRLIVSGNITELKDLYLLNSRRISFIIMPASIFLCFFSYRLLFLYTKNEALASQSHLLLSMFVIGFLINSTLHLPYNLALAVGYTRRIIYLYLVLLVIYIPLLYAALLTGKIINAGIAYALLQVTYLLLLVPLIERKIKLIPLKTWYWEVLIKPLVVSMAFILPAYFLLRDSIILQQPLYLVIFSAVLLTVLYLFIEKKFNLFNLFNKNSKISL